MNASLFAGLRKVSAIESNKCTDLEDFLVMLRDVYGKIFRPCVFGDEGSQANWLIDSNGKTEGVMISDHHGH